MTRLQEVHDEAYAEAIRGGATKREALDYAQEQVQAEREATVNRMGGALEEDEPYYANPTSSSGLAWLVGGVIVAGAAWLYYQSKKSTTWNCRAGMRCTHFVKDNSWQAKNLLDNSLAIYSTPPDNLKDLTLEETAPDGSYHVYNSIKAAVMTDGLPDYTP
jgi:hypothetical protein